ncbi:MAG: hypothetical protein J0I06_08900 [Planctomycetes bacterium]|nr:hypothetical protein [Planctomycetota bacterium]
MKTITGLLAILLGGVGTLVALACVGALWWGTFRLAAQVEKVSAQADQSLAQVGESLDGLKKQLVANARAAESARAAAARAGGRLDTVSGREEFEGVRLGLLALAEQGSALGEALAPIAQMIENAAALAEQGGGAARADRLRVIANNVRGAAQELEGVRDRSDAIRKGGAATTRRELQDFAQQVRGPLDRLTAALSDAKQESEGLRKELPGARQALDEWKLTGAGVGTAVLLWCALGQLAIVAWGRRRLAARNPAPQPAAGAK